MLFRSESPSPLFDRKDFRDLRKKMGKAALKIAEAANYTSAGTVEFIVDDHANFYFLEMNKRIQVEHPVTEEVTGIDLVKQMILIAAGEQLRISQGDITTRGHALECRINAEDPFDDFRPSPGRIDMYYAPGGPGVRIDSHAYAGYTIPPYYDSMIAKLIVWGEDRAQALARLDAALRDTHIVGLHTNVAFLRRCAATASFAGADLDTGLIEQIGRAHV